MQLANTKVCLGWTLTLLTSCHGTYILISDNHLQLLSVPVLLCLWQFLVLFLGTLKSTQATILNQKQLNISHSTCCLSLFGCTFSQDLIPEFSLNGSISLFELSTQTLATSPNWYAAGISGSTSSSGYLVKGIMAALSFSQECGMAELLTKLHKPDIQRVYIQSYFFSLCPSLLSPVAEQRVGTENTHHPFIHPCML